MHLRPFLLWLGSGYMLEYERILVAEGAADAPESYNHRWTSYLAARLALLGDRLLLQDTLYAQPRLDDFSDVRVLNEVQAQAKVSELFAMGVTLGVLYDSQPPTGVVPLDLRLVTTLHLAFK